MAGTNQPIHTDTLVRALQSLYGGKTLSVRPIQVGSNLTLSTPLASVTTNQITEAYCTWGSVVIPTTTIPTYNSSTLSAEYPPMVATITCGVSQSISFDQYFVIADVGNNPWIVAVSTPVPVITLPASSPHPIVFQLASKGIIV
jgi:hypothetical protein